MEKIETKTLSNVKNLEELISELKKMFEKVNELFGQQDDKVLSGLKSIHETISRNNDIVNENFRAVKESFQQVQKQIADGFSQLKQEDLTDIANTLRKVTMSLKKIEEKLDDDSNITSAS